MKTNILNSFSLMRNNKLNYGIRAVLVMLLFFLGAGNAWGTATYKLQLKTVTQNNTGYGKVYAGETNATPEYSSYYTSKDPAYDAVEQSSKEYYLWAVPIQRGVVFNNWTTSSTSSGSCTAGSSTLTDANKMQGAKVTVKAPTDASGTDTYTTTATVTANWNQHTKAVITYAKPTDGKYRVTYEYSYLNTSTNALETGFTFDMDGSSAARSEDSYNNDVITLQSLDGIFEGWYSGSTLLSKNNPYTYVAPASGGSVTISAHYTHVDKYYGKLTASIAEVPYSMPGGGTIFIANDPDVSGTYSADAQSVSNETYGESQKYYLHAQPNDKRYVFRGWYNNPECTGTALSTSADYTYTFTATSMNSASPTLGNVYAAFDFNLYYMQVEVEPAVPGLGMVLVSDTKQATAPEYTAFSTHAEQFAYAYRLRPTADVYLYAKPKYGYKLAGWYTDVDCTVAATVAADGKYTATGSSTDPMNPTITTLYAKFVEDDSKVNITYNIPDKTKGEYTASVLDIAEVDDDFVWTFTEVYNSANYSANTTLSQNKTDVLRLEAQPKAGYGVTSWTIAGTAKTTPSHLYETTATAAATHGVTFGDAKPFLVSAADATTGTQYATLAEALANLGSNKKITVVQNAYVPAGNYTIPNGVTLLIPYSEDYTINTTPSTVTKGTPNRSVYVTLTLGDGAIINVNGSVCVNAVMCLTMGYNGSAMGKYGLIDMNTGSQMNFKNSSNCYAWGYVIGEGQITAESGATIHETFQFKHRGGTAMSSIAGSWSTESHKVFPINQYYIQSIESPILIKKGASEKVYTGVHNVNSAVSIDFIGTSGLFQLTGTNAYLIKQYDVNLDRQKYTLYGNATISSITFGMSGFNKESKDYVLPITNNMTLDIESGTTTIQYETALLPDVQVIIGSEAKVVASGNCYVYDSLNWKGAYAYACQYSAADQTTTQIAPVVYRHGGLKYDRKKHKLRDVTIDVQGEMSGNIYTTTGGANIMSSGSGKVTFSASRTATTTFQVGQDGSSPTWDAYSLTSAQLHNGDGSYVQTSTATDADQFIYSKSQEKWLKNPKVVSWNANGGETEASTLAYSEGDFLGELPAAYKDGYTLEGWYTAADGGSQIAATTKVTANATYYAHWTPKTYTISYRDQGGVAFSGTHVDSPKAHPTTHTFGTAITLNNATKEHYTFGGWYRTPSCSGAVVTSIAASERKNITLYAKWTINSHALTWVTDGDALTGLYTSGSVNFGAIITAPNTPTKTNYVFNGWHNGTSIVTPASTMPDNDLTYTAQWTPAVASVTANNVTTNYATIQEAFTAANEKTGATVKLLQDITITSEIALTAAMTIDLNGKTIKSTQVAAVGVFKINASGKTVTIKDSGTGGKIDHTASYAGGYMYGINLTAGTLNIERGTIYAKNTANNRAYGIYNAGTTNLNISGGTIEATSTTSPFGIYDNSNCTLTMTGGTFTASGPTSRGIYTKGTTTLTNATITASGSSGRAIFAVSGEMTINSGTYTTTGGSDNLCIYHRNNAITINGGYFSTSNKLYEREEGKTGTITLRGGYYNNDTELEEKCATNYHVLPLTGEDPYMYEVAEAYTVTFNANGHGTAPEAQVIKKGEMVTEPAAPTAADYLFGGWYKEAGCTNEWNFSTDVVTADRTLFANWTPVNCTITWKNYDGKNLGTSTIEYNGQPGYPTTYSVPKRATEGGISYEWDGWTTESYGEGTFYDIEGLPDATSDATYYAHFRITAIDVASTSNISINEDAEVTTTTVRVNGRLAVSSTLTTDDLILEATPSSSGTISGIENITVNSKAYFDYKFDVEPWHWSAFGVPFVIDLKEAAPLKEKETELALGTDYDIIYYNTEKRAQQGPGSHCWEYVDHQAEHKLIPGVQYMIAFNKPKGHVDTVRFTKATNASINYDGNLNLVITGEAAGNNNWNGIANPKMYHALLDAGVTECQVHDGGEIGKDGYYTYDMSDKKFFVGKSAFVQVPSGKKSVVINEATTQDAIQQKLQAPRRAKLTASQGTRYDVQIAPSEEEVADRLLVLTDEDKADEYVIVSDLAKAGVSPVRAQIWVDRYGEKLCKNTTSFINNKADYPIVISTPKAGEYDIFINDQPDDETMLYLTYDGEAIWNLSYGGYVANLEKGTNSHYGLRIVRSPKVTTDIEEATILNGDAVRKVIVEDKVLIIRANQVYSIDGRLVK